MNLSLSWSNSKSNINIYLMEMWLRKLQDH